MNEAQEEQRSFVSKASYFGEYLFYFDKTFCKSSHVVGLLGVRFALLIGVVLLVFTASRGSNNCKAHLCIHEIIGLISCCF